MEMVVTLKYKVLSLMEENDICDILHIIADALQQCEGTEAETIGVEIEEAADRLCRCGWKFCNGCKKKIAVTKPQVDRKQTH